MADLVKMVNKLIFIMIFNLLIKILVPVVTVQNLSLTLV